MAQHRVTFLHEIVRCKDCGQPITAEQWSRDESCPGRRDRETEVDERGLTWLEREMFRE